jgi:chromosome segregation ATPase
LEHPGAIHNRLEQAKVILQDLNKQIERNRRLLGAELAKIEPNSHRIEGYESTIKELEEKIESVPYQIEALEKRLEEAIQSEEGRDRAAAMAAPLITRLQKISRHQALVLREANELNDEILKIIGEINRIEREAKIKIARPCCSTGYQSIKPIYQSIAEEVNGNSRTLFFWPGQDWPA